MVKPLSGQENLEEKVIDSFFLNFFGKVSFSYSTIKSPFDKFNAVSTLSANLFPILELITILSTIIEISCLTFLFKLGKSSMFKYLPSTFIFENPLFL